MDDEYILSERDENNRKRTNEMLKNNTGHDGPCRFRNIQNMGAVMLFACEICGKTRVKFWKK